MLSPGSLRGRAYIPNVATLKRYGDSRYKIAQMRVIRAAGVELPYTEKGTVNDSKLSNNIARARSKVMEYGYCNQWEYFATFTLNKDMHDRYDLPAFNRHFSQWLRDLRKSTGAQVAYLLIPEQHADGAWHMHGLLSGMPEGHLQPFDTGKKLTPYIVKKIRSGQPIYNWPAYAAKFGFVTVEPIRDKDRATSYITKYITKDLARCVTKMGAHLFYASRGLETAQELARGTLKAPIPVDYENEHCAVTWFDADAVEETALRDLFTAL